jgi:hypothetical protein
LIGKQGNYQGAKPGGLEMIKLKNITTIAMMTAVIAIGAVSGFAQANCADESKATLDAEFRANFPGDRAARKKAVAAGEQYLAKFETCADDKVFVDYLKSALPKMKERIKNEEEEEGRIARYNKFDAAVKAKNYDQVYAVGKEILQFEPDQLDLMITLGSIGYDESIDNSNYKYNADTLRFARQAITALESGKTSTTYGLFGWGYKTKDNALGEMNLAIGYITAVAEKNRKDALPYLYKATVASAETSKNPVPYEQIGLYYRAELEKLIDELKVLEADQKDSDTEDVAKAKVDAIKAKVAMINGAAERAMDAYSRAFKLSKVVAYQNEMKKVIDWAHNVRFARTTGVDAWINTAVTRPFPNPLTPITPVTDGQPSGSSATTVPAAISVEAAPVVVTTSTGAASKRSTAKKAPVKRKAAV